MAFVPTFADYVNSLGRNPDMTEAQFNALSDADKWSVAGGVAQIRNNDSRYNDLAGQTGGEAGRNLYVTQGSRRDFHGGLVGNEADLGNGVFAHNESSQSPQLQAYGHTQFDPMLLALPLAFTGLGMLSQGGLSGLFGGASSEAALPGMLSNFATPEVGALNLSGLEGAMNGLGLTAGETAGVTLPGLMDNFSVPTTGSSAMNTAGLQGVMDSLPGGGFLSNLFPGGATASNLLRAAGLATSAYGLLGGNRGNNQGAPGGSDGSSGDKGGSGKGLNITRGQYTPNPITQQQLQNFRYAQPRGLGGY